MTHERQKTSSSPMTRALILNASACTSPAEIQVSITRNRYGAFDGGTKKPLTSPPDGIDGCRLRSWQAALTQQYRSSYGCIRTSENSRTACRSPNASSSRKNRRKYLRVHRGRNRHCEPIKKPRFRSNISSRRILRDDKTSQQLRCILDRITPVCFVKPYSL